jgi:hypothetical protein
MRLIEKSGLLQLFTNLSLNTPLQLQGCWVKLMLGIESIPLPKCSTVTRAEYFTKDDFTLRVGRHPGFLAIFWLGKHSKGVKFTKESLHMFKPCFHE